MIRRYDLAWCVLAGGLMLAGMTGCSSSMTLRVLGTTDLNNGGNTVVVRVYLLRNDVSFRQATVESFWENDAQILGPDLIDTIEIRLRPRQTRQLKVPLPEGVKYIGAAADFYKPDKDGWHRLYSMVDNKGKEVDISIGMQGISVQGR